MMQRPPPESDPHQSGAVSSGASPSTGQPAMDRYNAPLRPHHYQQNTPHNLSRDSSTSDDGTRSSYNNMSGVNSGHFYSGTASSISEGSVRQLSLPKRSTSPVLANHEVVRNSVPVESTYTKPQYTYKYTPPLPIQSQLPTGTNIQPALNNRNVSNIQPPKTYSQTPISSIISATSMPAPIINKPPIYANQKIPSLVAHLQQLPPQQNVSNTGANDNAVLSHKPPVVNNEVNHPQQVKSFQPAPTNIHDTTNKAKIGAINHIPSPAPSHTLHKHGNPSPSLVVNQVNPPPPTYLNQDKQFPPTYVNQSNPPPSSSYGNQGNPPIQTQMNQSNPPQPYMNKSNPPPMSSQCIPPKYSLPSPVPSLEHPANEMLSPGPSMSSSTGTLRKSGSRIDPSQMPRPPCLRTDIKYHTRAVDDKRKCPPLSNDIFEAIDNGNASPRYIRPSLCAPPTTKEVLKQVSIPMGFLATPFAAPENGESPVPLVDMNEHLPPRCTRCKGYINCHVQWKDDGNSWICNLCTMSNTTPPWYYCSLDGAYQRLDRDLRKELSLGSIDFVVDKEYCLRPMQEPIYIFAIDVGSRALSSGFTIAAIRAIQNNLAHLPGDIAAKAGIITFSDKIHYYLLPESSKPFDIDKVSIMLSDADDPCAVLPMNRILLSISENLEKLNLLLRKIPELVPKVNTSVDNYMWSTPIAAIKAAQLTLQSCGGRLFLFTPCHPTAGFGKIRIKENNSAYGTVNELSMYGSLNVLSNACKDPVEKDVYTLYNDLIAACVGSYIGVDVFYNIDSDEYREVALLSDLCMKTGGNMHILTGSMTIEDNVHRLEQALTTTVCNIVASEAVFKLRTSIGLKLERLLSKGRFDETLQELSLCVADRNCTVCCILEHDGSIVDEAKTYLQVAVLYTNLNKQRLVRVHNICLIASNNHTVIFRNADLDATTAIIAKMGMDKALHVPLHDEAKGPKSYITRTVNEVLHKYRVYIAASSPRGQLILPESLKLLPLYSLGLLKHPSLLENIPATGQAPLVPAYKTGGSSSAMNGAIKVFVRGHERSYQLRQLLNAPVKELINSLYPRLFRIDHLDPHADVDVTMLNTLPVTSEVFDSDGIYMLDDGFYLYIYIGRGVSQSLLEELFAVPAHERPQHLTLRQNSLLSNRISDLIEILRSSNHTKGQLKVIWADEPQSFDSVRFSARIVEDSIFGVLSYTDYLCKVHQQIQTKMSQ